MDAKFYWTIVVSVITGIWATITFLRTRLSNSIAQTNSTVSRLVEYDKLNLQNPDVQKFLSGTVKMPEDYFRDTKRLQEELFFKVKSLVYKQLNIFDEILSVSTLSSRKLSFIKPVLLYEISDWETYIKEKLRHPLYRSILNNEGHIFGKSLRKFWLENKQSIESNTPDPFIW